MDMSGSHNSFQNEQLSLKEIGSDNNNNFNFIPFSFNSATPGMNFSGN